MLQSSCSYRETSLECTRYASNSGTVAGPRLGHCGRRVLGNNSQTITGQCLQSICAGQWSHILSQTMSKQYPYEERLHWHDIMVQPSLHVRNRSFTVSADNLGCSVFDTYKDNNKPAPDNKAFSWPSKMQISDKMKKTAGWHLYHSALLDKAF